MIKKQIILIGAGGHCKSCIDVLESENKFEIIGILDLPNRFGQDILGYKIIGNDNDIPQLAKDGQIHTYQHDGFWMPMDSLRDKTELNKLWKNKQAPWKVWK